MFVRWFQRNNSSCSVSRTLDCSPSPQRLCIGYTIFSAFLSTYSRSLECLQLAAFPYTLLVLLEDQQVSGSLSPSWWFSSSTWCLSRYTSLRTVQKCSHLFKPLTEAQKGLKVRILLPFLRPLACVFECGSFSCCPHCVSIFTMLSVTLSLFFFSSQVVCVSTLSSFVINLLTAQDVPCTSLPSILHTLLHLLCFTGAIPRHVLF